MNIEEMRDCCLSVKGAGESFPFEAFNSNNVLVFKVAGKMFAFIDIVPSDGIFVLWLKCDPERALRLRNEYEGITASTRHLAKTWNGVNLESDVPGGLIKELIAHSAEEVIKKLPKKQQELYRSL